MTADEYWNGDCSLARAYLKRAKMDRDLRDIEQWRQGLYILDAVSVAIARGINGNRKAKYPERPYGWESPDSKEQTMLAAKAKFEARAATINAKRMVQDG
mgnify:FL=1